MNEKQTHDDVYQMLSQSGYSDKAIQYFQAKENIGVIENADQITDVTGPCGDTIKISMDVVDERIRDAKIQVLGCPGAIASACAVVNLAKAKTLKEASQIDLDTLDKELEKLPDQKIQCARLAVKTLQKALEQYGGKDRDRAANEHHGRHR